MGVPALFSHLGMHHKYDCASWTVLSENSGQVCVDALVHGVAEQQNSALTHLDLEANFHLAGTR